jgi:hypothetical protein
VRSAQNGRQHCLPFRCELRVCVDVRMAWVGSRYNSGSRAITPSCLPMVSKIACRWASTPTQSSSNADGPSSGRRYSATSRWLRSPQIPQYLSSRRSYSAAARWLSEGARVVHGGKVSLLTMILQKGRHSKCVAPTSRRPDGTNSRRRYSAAARWLRRSRMPVFQQQAPLFSGLPQQGR